MATPDRASLLGLPPELRLHIYDHILASDTPYTPLNGMNGGRDAGGSISIPLRNADARLCLQWVNLLQTCLVIATEIHDLVRGAVGPENDGARATYVMSTDIGNGQGRMGKVTWSRIPCAPSDARVLVVNIGADERLSMWGDGGPMGMPRFLYQSLNLILHCGPRMDPSRPLAQPLYLREVVVNVQQRKDPKLREMMARPMRSGDGFWEIDRLLSFICNRNLLAGYVEEVRLTDGTQEKVRVVGAESTGVPPRWERYGFQWGLAVWEGRAPVYEDV